jgi:hypothetical protein
VDSEKIKSIEEWPMLRNVADEGSFMELTRYYIRFVECFSKTTHPITSLQNKGVRFDWTLNCAKSFQHLKSLFTSVPILRIIDLDEDFIVCTYSYKEGLGGVLSQNGHVICYELRKLKYHERIYATHDLELEAIVDALKMWWHYLMGKIFELRTYHSGMKYLFGQPILNARQSRWLKFLSEYDFDIKHIQGKEKKVVDTLSKRVHKIHVISINMYKSDLNDKILEVAKSDPYYVDIKERL